MLRCTESRQEVLTARRYACNVTCLVLTIVKVLKFHAAIAEKSGGTHLKLSEFGRMREMFMGICYREAAEVQYQQHGDQIAALKRTESAQLLLPETMKGKKVNSLRRLISPFLLRYSSSSMMKRSWRFTMPFTIARPTPLL